jgi:hypothetical protein
MPKPLTFAHPDRGQCRVQPPESLVPSPVDGVVVDGAFMPEVPIPVSPVVPVLPVALLSAGSG